MYHALLIFGQFVLAALLVLSARWSPVPWTALLLGLPGVLLAVWAWFTMGWFRLRIHPTATERTRMLVSGPYGFVRHPMYSGLLWFTAALLLSGFHVWRIVLWIGLLIVLLAKSREEEISILSRFPEYADYQSKVGRVLPKV